MGIEEKVKDLEPRIIQWLTIEKEVMEEVNKRFVAGIITREEWNAYFIELVNLYGGNIMTAVLDDFMKIQSLVLQDLDEEKIKKGVQRLLDLDRFTENTATTYTIDLTTIPEDILVDLEGNEYPTVIKNGVFMCPKCGDHLIRMFANENVDSVYFRCVATGMDFKKKNKPSKDLII